MSAVQTETISREIFSPPQELEFRLLALDLIDPSPYQARASFDEAELLELGENIRANGLLEPLVVRPPDPKTGRHQLIAGERRLRAMRLVGILNAAVTVRDVDDRVAQSLVLIENLHRKNLDPVEEATGYRSLAELGMTQTEIGQAINRSQPAIANAIRLLELPEDVLQEIRAGQLSAAHGRALVKFAKWPKLCNAIAEQARDEGYTSKRLEAGFDYEGISVYKLPDGVLASVGYGERKAAEKAGITVWDGSYTPDVEAYRQFIKEREAAEKQALEERLAAARAAAHTSEPEDEVEDLEQLPGRDPETKNGRRRRRKDTEKAAAPKLPKLSELPYGSYEVVNKDTYGRPWPKACGPDCECRAKAIDHNGDVVEISTRPRHISALRGQELRKQKQAEKKAALALEERVQVKLASAPAFDTRGLAIVTAELLNAYQSSYGSSSIDGDVRKSLVNRYLPDAPDYIHRGGVDKKALDALASLPAQTIVSLLIEALLQTDLDRMKKDAGEPPMRLTWYLKEKSDEPKPKTAAAPMNADQDLARARLTAIEQQMEASKAASTPAHVEVCVIAHKYALLPEGVETEDVEQLLELCDSLRMDPTVSEEDRDRLDALAKTLAQYRDPDAIEEAAS